MQCLGGDAAVMLVLLNTSRCPIDFPLACTLRNSCEGCKGRQHLVLVGRCHGEGWKLIFGHGTVFHSGPASPGSLSFVSRGFSSSVFELGAETGFARRLIRSPVRKMVMVPTTIVRLA